MCFYERWWWEWLVCAGCGAAAGRGPGAAWDALFVVGHWSRAKSTLLVGTFVPDIYTRQ